MVLVKYMKVQMILLIVGNIIFWTPLAYWVYNSYMRPSIESAVDRNKAKKFASKWGGMESIYSQCIDYFERRGFELLTIGKRKLHLKNRLRSYLWELEVRQESKNRAEVNLVLEQIEGGKHSCRIQFGTDDDQSKMIHVLLIKFAWKNIDSKFVNQDNPEVPEKEFENIFSRRELYLPMWKNIYNSNSTPNWAREIISHHLAPDGVFPQSFFENYRYFKQLSSNPILKSILEHNYDKYTSQSVDRLYDKMKKYSHIKYPYWYISAYPDIVMRNIVGEKGGLTSYTDEDGQKVTIDLEKHGLNYGFKKEGGGVLKNGDMDAIKEYHKVNHKIETRRIVRHEPPKYALRYTPLSQRFRPAASEFEENMLS